MQKYQSTFNRVQEIVQNIKRGVVYGAYQSSSPILSLLSRLIEREHFERPGELMNVLKGIGKYVQIGTQSEYATVNIVRRVMFMAREVEKSMLNEDFDVQANELHRLTFEHQTTSTIDMVKYKELLVEMIKEFQQELSTLYESIAEQGELYINDNDTILLYGKSRTVLEFVAGAKRNRKFNVIVIESLQRHEEKEIVNDLKAKGIQSHLISESSLFSILPRVNKIILGCHSVFANGGLVATSGAYNLCSAANHFHVPVYVCTGTYKICPNFPTNSNGFSLIQSPLPITPVILSTPAIGRTTTGLEEVLEKKLDVDETVVVNEYQIKEAQYVRVINSTFDYIQPDWINLFITNEKGVSPSYIYRLVAQLYNPEDTFFIETGN
ncbi:translation initiation factor eIF-2B subunit alpha, putative [Entamoeba dispar SAW760]|uniref:Translation initiation factor eIF2B subunit beta n=1 Tax=Entamoeba dispar (strain ATCC PRA-260 / SAW760) TaxID=370354 RepID=B0E829_ENTDS|nr:translation initiation factor eIF-2B subunit alpha, putative [Entamoeba dispar SAW760]EDR29317.1 translation initiation factor eIF-2B subunit alpha, putative [Entamoeba dispar SAW760]|eukprot:EDR29317.1 translation initiation factor eIF-2B subunit alpha, putative [Entamoeba dispar SAW760]